MVIIPAGMRQQNIGGFLKDLFFALQKQVKYPESSEHQSCLRNKKSRTKLTHWKQVGYFVQIKKLHQCTIYLLGNSNDRNSSSK